MPPLLALLSWPLIVLAFARSFAPSKAFILAIMIGFLFLPENTAFNLPLLPALNKHTIPALAVVVFLALFRTKNSNYSELSLIPKHVFVRVAMLGLVIGAFMTVVTNGDPLSYGPTYLPGLRLYDGFSQILSTVLLLLPMLLARRFLSHPDTHVLLLQVFCVAALGYSLLALFEIRMSPQLNQWVYGFFPHSWAQHYRGGGWRPIVFLGHGLILSMFFCMAILATAGLYRISIKNRGLLLVALGWIFVTLVMTKSLGALGLTVLVLPVVLFFGVRAQLVFASALAVLVMIYPMTRALGVAPIYQVQKFAAQIDPQRASSFGTRLKNEDRMLKKAQQRPLFGWGGWGRSRVLDAETGRDITIADGFWVIELGVGGWVRYLSEFGLLCVPICFLLLQRRRYDIGLETSALALMLAANMLDLIPNSSNTPLTWVIAGAIWGRLELGAISKTQREPAQNAAKGMPSNYHRGLSPVRRKTKGERPPEMGQDIVPDEESKTKSGRLSRYSRQTVDHDQKQRRNTT